MHIGIHQLLIRIGIVIFWFGLLTGILALSYYIIMNRSTEKTLTILAMPNSINADTFDAFERIHGVKVHVSYAENADELYMKLVITKAAGYDLVMISDYQIPLLKQNNLIQPLDKNALPFFKDIYPALLNHTFDPHNYFSIPYYWGVYGFAVDSAFFSDRKKLGWEAIFDETQISYCIGMREDAREIILMAALYLFGRIDNLDQQDFEKIKQLLIKQKQWVTLYADERIGNLLASRSCPLVVTLSGDIMRTMALYPYIKFFIPQEGGFVDIDSFVIPAQTKQKELVYALLNYIYRPDVLGYYVDKFKFIPPIKTVQAESQIPELQIPTPELFKRLHFFNTKIPADKISEIIIALKTA
ncbi:MAG TPA: spermidine/putrescine ABC transporter substrate-binding protein [Candidatus Babeliales bacterium]|nr:spermidine/putrescine ABC transporter substrate-binding protein [Candidatus Babeliales bacterium]